MKNKMKMTKKRMLTLCTAIVLLVVTVFVSTAALATALVGDVDQNGVANTADIRVMLRHLVKGEPVTTDQQQPTEDAAMQDVRDALEATVRETTTTVPTTVITTVSSASATRATSVATTAVPTTSTTTEPTTAVTEPTETTVAATTVVTEPTAPTYAQVEPFELTEFEQRMFDILNEERAKAGVAPLRFAYEDYECAKIRAREQMQAEGHTRPDGRACRTVYEDLGMAIPEYRGENLALYQTTPEFAMEGLMNSDGHRANILNENYTAVAIGVVFDQDGYPMYSQLFKR